MGIMVWGETLAAYVHAGAGKIAALVGGGPVLEGDHID